MAQDKIQDQLFGSQHQRHWERFKHPCTFLEKTTPPHKNFKELFTNSLPQQTPHSLKQKLQTKRWLLDR